MSAPPNAYRIQESGASGLNIYNAVTGAFYMFVATYLGQRAGYTLSGAILTINYVNGDYQVWDLAKRSVIRL